MRQIDLHVARLLAKSIERNRNKIPEEEFKFSLNISAESLKSDAFGEALVEELERINSSQKRILIEVTESAMMGMSSAVKRNVAAIRESGYDFSIDDFGTGYSSLSRLQDLPLEEVKIDRSFVARLGSHHNSSDMVVRAILALAKELGLRTVAEGVETRAQRAWLTGQGCDEAQGYHFDRPMEAEVFFSRIRRMNRSKRQEIGILPLRA
jgi:EAL domain-containing protein (putative c-di-GMP-specific phosphodiesterase class I)